MKSIIPALLRPPAPAATGFRTGFRAGRSALAALAALALSGCASVYLVDNQVQSYARWADVQAAPSTPAQAAPAVPQPPQVYRFERLPSQGDARTAAAQDQLEALTRPALERVGWTLADAGAATPWRVEVSASTLRLPRAPWEEPWYGPWGGAWGGPWGGMGWPGRDHVVTGTGQVMWSPMFMRMDIPYFQRQVSLLIRHAGTGRVVYETRAAHDGRWHSSPALWGAMLDASLQGFPVPPAGVRQINIELPR